MSARHLALSPFASSSLAVLALLFTFAAPAHADQPRKSEFGGDLLYGNLDLPIVGSASLIGLEVHGTFLVTPGLTLGGRLPIAHLSVNDNTGTSLGNLAAELAYQTSARPRSHGWIEVSLSFPTAADSGDAGLAALTFADFWIPDRGKYAPNTTTVRGSYHHAFGAPEQQLLLSAGAQYLSVDGDDDRLLLPLVIGGRIALGNRAAAIGRLTTLWDLDARNGEDDFYHVIEAGLELLQLGKGTGELVVYVPLDDRYRQDLNAWGLRFGFAAPI